MGHIVKFLDKKYNKRDRLKFLDLGSGSGAVSIALLQECTNVREFIWTIIVLHLVKLCFKKMGTHYFFYGTPFNSFSPIQLEGHAVDVSEEAVQLTRENAIRNNVEDRLTVMLATIQTALQPKQQRTPFDFIVSNPPYIPTEHIPSLQTEVEK